jgi:ATP-dependent RNA/DNA helicase IGHMBP2
MPLEPEYFASLARLYDLERQAEKTRIQEDKDTLPLLELAARGLVLLDVESQEYRVGLGGRHVVSFARADKRPLNARLGTGDVVSVSPRKAEMADPPVGTVTRGTRFDIEVAFERPLPEWTQEGRLRLDVVPNDATVSRIKAGLQKLQAFERGQERERRDILLGHKPPRFEKMPEVNFSQSLNTEQQLAVLQALSARDFSLVWGPPGTGKSTVLSEIAVQVVRAHKRLLCVAASNTAVDRLLELCLDAGLRAVRVGHPARVLPHLQAHTLDLLVEEHQDRKAAREMFDEAFELLGYARKQRHAGRSRARFANAREASAAAYQLMDEARVLEKRAVNHLLAGAQVVCCTLAATAGHVLAREEFDVALVDEATQATEGLTLLAFTKAPQVILAGDPKQLGPTVLSQAAAQQGLQTSLFERLLKEHGDVVKTLLTQQHRMHERIMHFPSQEMYRGQLRAHASVAQRTLRELLHSDLEAPPLLFIDTAGKGFDEAKLPGTESLMNAGEADLVVARARALMAAGLSPTDIGIVTPYSSQAAHMRELLDVHPSLEVDTVDAFQGREKEAILVSCVRSNMGQHIGFLSDLRRMNVALTRAKRHVCVVGDSATLSAHPFFARLIEEAQRQEGYRSAWEWTEA